jgi:hypothetical protein
MREKEIFPELFVKAKVMKYADRYALFSKYRYPTLKIKRFRNNLQM